MLLVDNNFLRYGPSLRADKNWRSLLREYLLLKESQEKALWSVLGSTQIGRRRAAPSGFPARSFKAEKLLFRPADAGFLCDQSIESFSRTFLLTSFIAKA
jgi:hypothetical protein